MRETGRKTNNMEKGKNVGLTDQLMKEIMWKARNQGKENSHGLIQASMKENSMMQLKGLELTHGQTSASLQESGNLTRCTVEVFSHGPMDDDSKDATSMTRSMGTDCSLGLMADLTKARGQTGSRTALESTFRTREK